MTFDQARAAKIITEVAVQVRSALTPLTGADWSTPARDLDWPDHEDPVFLLWCSGRIALPDHPRRSSWAWIRPFVESAS